MRKGKRRFQVCDGTSIEAGIEDRDRNEYKLRLALKSKSLSSSLDFTNGSKDIFYHTVTVDKVEIVELCFGVVLLQFPL
jgi:hypothetical protein